MLKTRFSHFQKGKLKKKWKEKKKQDFRTNSLMLKTRFSDKFSRARKKKERKNIEYEKLLVFWLEITILRFVMELLSFIILLPQKINDGVWFVGWWMKPLLVFFKLHSPPPSEWYLHHAPPHCIAPNRSQIMWSIFYLIRQVFQCHSLRWPRQHSLSSCQIFLSFYLCLCNCVFNRDKEHWTLNSWGLLLMIRIARGYGAILKTDWMFQYLHVHWKPMISHEIPWNAFDIPSKSLSP